MRLTRQSPWLSTAQACKLNELAPELHDISGVQPNVCDFAGGCDWKWPIRPGLIPVLQPKITQAKKTLALLGVKCCKGLLDCGLLGSKTLKQSAFQVQVTNTFKLFPRAREWSVKGCMRIWNSFSSPDCCLCSSWNCSRSSRTQQLN